MGGLENNGVPTAWKRSSEIREPLPKLSGISRSVDRDWVINGEVASGITAPSEGDNIEAAKMATKPIKS